MLEALLMIEVQDRNSICDLGSDYGHFRSMLKKRPLLLTFWIILKLVFGAGKQADTLLATSQLFAFLAITI